MHPTTEYETGSHQETPEAEWKIRNIKTSISENKKWYHKFPPIAKKPMSKFMSEKNWPLTVGLVILESDSTSVVHTKASKKWNISISMYNRVWEKRGKAKPTMHPVGCASEKLELSSKRTERCEDLDRMMLATHL
jgi:hypothetical protein